MFSTACRLLIAFALPVTHHVTHPITLSAQVSLVDEGTFSLYVGGARVGREDFSIRAAPGPGGSAFIAQGNVLVGGNRVTVALNADSAGYPLRFQLEARLDGQVVETISGESRRGLWMGRALRERGESAREFRVPPGAIAAVEGVVHQLWFVLRLPPGSTPTLLLPRSLTLRQVALEDAGSERVSLGLHEFVTRRWIIQTVDDSAPVVEAWTDMEGRLLRVRIPSQDLEALRDEPPRETPAA